jgi:hypothetical protein
MERQLSLSLAFPMFGKGPQDGVPTAARVLSSRELSEARFVKNTTFPETNVSRIQKRRSGDGIYL